MRKCAFTVIFLTICLLLSNLQGYSQRFIGYAAAGANFGQIEGDDVHGFTKIGANAGLGLKLPVNRAQTMSVTAELLYVQKGAYSHHFVDTMYYHTSMFEDVDRSVPFKTFSKCNISLDYVQIPVMFNYEDTRTGCTFGLGFSWSRLVRAKETYNGFRRTTTIRSGTYNTSDRAKEATAKLRTIQGKTQRQNFKAKNFDYVTPAGTFSIRNAADIIEPSGYMVIDVDDLNTQEQVEATFKMLLGNRRLETLLLFRSPSGNGVKWIIRIVNNEGHDYLYFFKAVTNYLGSLGIKVDQSGKDISRACYLPHDPNAYINELCL